MKKYLLNYATPEFIYSQKLLSESAKKNGIDGCFSYQKEDLLRTSFYKKHKNILDEPKGAGYWLWKPYYILEILKQIDFGDVLFYADSGIEIVGNIDVLAEIAKEKDILLFVDGGLHKNYEYIKPSCFRYMDCDNGFYKNSYQLMASFQVYKKTEKSLRFVKEWLDWCSIKKVIDDSDEIGDYTKGYIAHRHDQSILSLLALKKKIKIFRDPTQWGNELKKPRFRITNEFLARGKYISGMFVNSNYPTLLNHHRKKIKPINWFIYKIKNLFI